MRCSVREGRDQPMPVDENVPGHDREARIVVRQKQARSKIEAEDRGGNNGDKCKPSRERSRGVRPARRCESAFSIWSHVRSPRGLHLAQNAHGA
jgi:hypothetical protein